MQHSHPKGQEWPGPIKTDTPNAEAKSETIARLAKLDLIEYDRVRDVEAETLGIRTATLDKVVRLARGESGDSDEMFPNDEAWNGAVAGAELLDDLTTVFKRYLILPNGAAEATALWVLHAHAHDTSNISPILCFTSPTPECGKSTALGILKALVPKALSASNISTSAVFRSVEKWCPTLLIDEADSFLRDNEELRGVLNSGHGRENAFIIRVTGEGANMQPGRFSTWAPKIIALIGKLPATLASRSIHIEMRRMAPGETVEPYRGADKVSLADYRRRAAAWAAMEALRLRDQEPNLPDALSGRRADNWRHLLAIADVAGGRWPALARTVAVSLSARVSESTTAVMLLTDIKTIFDELEGDKITSIDLADALAAIETRPWGEWQRGKPITARQLARLLAAFEIAPGPIRLGSQVAKGYEKTKFADVFARYLPNDQLHGYKAQKSAEIHVLRSVTKDPGVTDETEAKAAETQACNRVTDQSASSAADDPFHIPEWLRRDGGAEVDL